MIDSQRPTRRLADLGNTLTKAVLTRFTAPLRPNDYAGLFDPLRGREIRGRIVDVDRQDSFTTIRIKPGPGLYAHFQPGQFIGVGLQIDGVWRWRCYSLPNPPQVTDPQAKRLPLRDIAISIKPVPDGTFSNHLADKARKGQLIRLTAPGGEFYLPQPVPDKLLFITAGAGITPVMSMLRWLKQECGEPKRGGDRAIDATGVRQPGVGHNRTHTGNHSPNPSGQAWPDIIHIHSERAATPSAPYGYELHELATRVPNYRLSHWNSSERGRLDPDDIATLAPDLEDRAIYACGPGELLDSMKEKFPHTITEHFFTNAGRRTSAPTDSGATLATTNPQPGGDIEFGDNGPTVATNGTTTILEAGESAGLHLPHGCRMGICRTCITTVEAGAAIDLRDGHCYGEGEHIRTCSCVPAGRVRVASPRN